MDNLGAVPMSSMGGVTHALHCRHPALAHDALWLFGPDRDAVIWCLRGQASVPAACHPAQSRGHVVSLAGTWP